MKYLSTFSGIGGFELGINKAYEQLQNNEHAHISEESEQKECTQRGEWSTDQPEVLLHDRDRTTPLCIGYSEINKYAIQIYEKQFTKRFPYCSDCWEQKKTKRELPTEGESIRCEGGESCINCGKSASLLFNIKPKNYGDITKINASELPDFDLFVGGFPCQAFSIAGKRGGFDDTRGTLFFDCARILKEKQPRHFILENVKGLLSHDNGRTFKTIINTLTELGYCVEWQVLNAKNFGVPQNRERVFIVGHLGGIPERKVFPITRTDREVDETSGVQSVSNQRELSRTLLARDYKDPKVVQVADYRNDEGLRIRSEPISPCLSARRTSATDISTMPPVILRGRPKMPYEQGKRELGYKTYNKIVPTLSTNPASGDAKNMVVQAVLTPDRLNKRQNGRRFKEDGEESFTLTAQDRHGVFNGTRIRRLTPIECERLMGYPDNWTEGLSDTQRYKTLGNGIVSNVVAEVVKRLTPLY